MPPIQTQNRRHKGTMKGTHPFKSQTIKANPILKTPLEGTTIQCGMSAILHIAFNWFAFEK